MKKLLLVIDVKQDFKGNYFEVPADIGVGIYHIDTIKLNGMNSNNEAVSLYVSFEELASINAGESTTQLNIVEKEVHWYLMMAESYYSKPQREEYFVDSGFYKYHEAYHLLKFANEKQILEKAYEEYLNLSKNKLWTSRK